ncbi:Uncharacterized protein APZ42_005058 [Daphnia magna]|uniref:Uncharacterized protein n=1 Tax=Daphnia magna TaxID=35525 RepID=A0A162BZ34_9CRUS|nr:Uncharacterized protein APZ42_005058 [Daphnia magna]
MNPLPDKKKKTKNICIKRKCLGIGDHDLCRASRVILLNFFFFCKPNKKKSSVSAKNMKQKNGNNTNQENAFFSHSHFCFKSSPSLVFSVISYSKQKRKKWG